jgi:hypothetical protein
MSALHGSPTIWTVLAALALSAADVSPLVGQGESESSRKTLAGLNGVFVWVGPVEDELQRNGLDTIQIRTDVELKLRQAGIPVRAEEQPSPGVHAPILYINLNALKSPDVPQYSFYVALQVGQEACLTRNPALTLRATTWSSGTFGTVGQSKLGSFVRDKIRDLTDRFINAYLAANPKR